MIRAFFAIDLSIEIRSAIQQILIDFKKNSRLPIRWSPVENIHITLKFLGDVTESQVMLLEQNLPGLLAKTSQFPVEVGKLGAFPKLDQPRVIWIGCRFTDAGMQMQRSLEEALFELGFQKDERRFSPHLTLGRVANHAQSSDLAAISQLIRQKQIGSLGTINANDIHLFRSDLTPTGAKYRILRSFPLL